MHRATWIALSSAATLGLGACSDPPSDGETGDSTSGGPTTSESEAGETSDESGAESTSGTSAGSDSGESGFPGEPPTVILPRSRLEDSELAVLVNDEDPQSIAVADVYMTARGLPAENLVHLSFPAGGPAMTQQDFGAAFSDMQAELPPNIQALALSWTQPYAVECMSITTAFSQGFDLGFCGGCAMTTPTPYYDSPSFYPFEDHELRPTMMLAGSTAEDVFALIERGLLADGSVHPSGDGYLVRTTDVARSVRYSDFIQVPGWWDHDGGLTMTYIDNGDGMGSNVITDTADVMFYFTGLADVPGIETNTYLPGAIADHLTSYGGQVPTSGQMSAVAWLEAGATASFGTVVEPCNHVQKFPRASVAIEHYFRGETLIEAYTKSVQWPGQGLFVGDPLARPWDGSTIDYDSDTGLLQITTTILQPGIDYMVQEGPSADGPWETLMIGSVGASLTLTIEVPEARAPYYRIQPEE